MSTRANIIIQDSQSKLWFYRHSDGYPDGAMPTLRKFMERIAGGQYRNNVSQSAGNLVLIGAEEYGNLNLGETYSSMMGWKCGSYEPTSGRHGDIEFLYVLDLDEKTIKCYSTPFSFESNKKDGLQFVEEFKQEVTA